MENRNNKLALADIYKYASLKQYEGLEGKTPVANGNTFLGVEIELENYIYTATPQTWYMVKDESLKLNGKELVTIPIRFKFFEIELDRLIEGTAGYTSSSRCSVHVHINARDFTQDELTTFLALYLIFEKSLFRVSGNRWHSNYCVPLYATPKIVSNFLKAGTCFNINGHFIWYKYSALNLCPIWGGESKRYGTIEFRHMEGCLEKKKLMNWCNLIVSLKTAAKNMSLESLLSHLKEMNTTSGYSWLVKEVFGNWAHLLTDDSNFKDDIESCITRTKYAMLNDENKLITRLTTAEDLLTLKKKLFTHTEYTTAIVDDVEPYKPTMI